VVNCQLFIAFHCDYRSLATTAHVVNSIGRLIASIRHSVVHSIKDLAPTAKSVLVGRIIAISGVVDQAITVSCNSQVSCLSLVVGKSTYDLEVVSGRCQGHIEGEASF
jgi:hypothetical protein